MLPFTIILIVFLAVNIISTPFVYALNLEAIQQLKRLNDALKQTQERLKEEMAGKSPEELKNPSFQRKMQEIFHEEYAKTKEKTYQMDDSIINHALKQCEDMKKSKEDLVSGASKKILAGAAVGAAVGAVAAGEKRRGEGAIIGAITGAMAGLGYELWTKKDLFEESPEKLAKRVKYDSSKGIHLKIGEIKVNKENVKTGDNLRLILRVEYLFPEFINNLSQKRDDNPLAGVLSKVKGGEREEFSPIYHTLKIKAYVVKEKGELLIAEEEYAVPPGTTPFLYVFPVCDAIPKGEHFLKFVVERMGVKDEKVVKFTKL